MRDVVDADPSAIPDVVTADVVTAGAVQLAAKHL